MPSLGWSLDPASGYSDAEALAEFNRVIFAVAQQRRSQRNYIVPVVRNYETNYFRENDNATKSNSSAEANVESKSDSEDASDASFVTAPQCLPSEEKCSIAEREVEREVESLVNELVDLAVAAAEPPSIVVTDYDSDSSSIILTPSSE